MQVQDIGGSTSIKVYYWLREESQISLLGEKQQIYQLLLLGG